MSKITFAFACIIFSTVSYSNEIDEQCSKFVIHGAPVSPITSKDQYICKKNYAVHYRYDLKVPEYVVEHLTLDAMKGILGRSGTFRVDFEIPKQYQAQLSDYAKSKYDRGQLTPPPNNTQSVFIMDDSYDLSNVMPTAFSISSGVLRDLEVLIRQWAADKDKDIYVITGTVFDDSYTTIGAGKVGVPTRIFKVIINHKNWKSIGFLIPNKIGLSIPRADLKNYAVSVYSVELATGIDFFPKLPNTNTSEIEEPNSLYWKGL